MSAKYTTAAPLFAALLFALLAIAFLPYLGIQNDESLFATVIYGPIARSNRLRALGHDVPLMVMTYVGTLKTWLYSLIFLVAKPSIWSLRMPVVLIGSATVFLFGRLLHKSIGFAGMCIGLILLTVDASFLMTTTFDWGPVALQHLLMVAGLLLILRFTDTYHWAHLGGAFFCFGLAVWDKALFTWSIAGLAAATLAIFHEELIVLCKPRNVAIALLGFALGAWPLILYNARNRGATFAGNATLVPADVPSKTIHLRSTLSGSALYGYMVREEWETAHRAPDTVIERASAGLRDFVGERREGLLSYLLIASLALAPWWWKKGRRPVLFCLIYLAVGWLLMAMTKDAGGSAHHVVLLWPMPHFLVAAALAPVAARGRQSLILVCVLVGIAAAQGFLVLNQHFSQLARFGTGVFWTDALEPLRTSLEKRAPKAVNVMDWGVDYTLLMLEQGRLPMRTGMAFQDPPTDENRSVMRDLLREEGALWVSHFGDLEVTPGNMKNAAALALVEGYRKETVETIADRMGRPIFEIYRFVK